MIATCNRPRTSRRSPASRSIDRWGTDVSAPLDAVSGALDTDTLRELNAADERVTTSRSVAAAWLRSRGLT